VKCNLKNFPQTFSHHKIIKWLEGFEAELREMQSECIFSTEGLIKEILGE